MIEKRTRSRSISVRPEDLRIINSRLIVGLVRHTPSTMTEIAERLGLSRPSVLTTVRGLEEEGLLVSGARRVPDSRGGRSPTVYQFNPQARFVVGVVMKSRYLAVGLLDLNAKLIEQTRVSVSPDFSPSACVSLIRDAVAGYRAKVGDKIQGIGVGVGGQVSLQGDVRFILELPKWQDVPLGDLIARNCQLPVWIDNSGRLQGLAELYFGLGRTVSHLICLQSGSGVGGSIIVDHKVYRGDGGAGPLGHMTIIPDGPRCRCGNHGCLEALVSNEALLRRAREEAGDYAPTTIEDLAALTRQHISWAVKIAIQEAGTWYGIALANVINVFSPQAVIIQGDAVKFGEELCQKINETIMERALKIPGYHCPVLFSTLGPDVGIRGAATFVIQEALGIMPIAPDL